MALAAVGHGSGIGLPQDAEERALDGKMETMAQGYICGGAGAMETLAENRWGASLARTHARMHARAHANTHAHACAQARLLAPEAPAADPAGCQQHRHALQRAGWVGLLMACCCMWRPAGAQQCKPPAPASSACTALAALATFICWYLAGIQSSMPVWIAPMAMHGAPAPAPAVPVWHPRNGLATPRGHAQCQ